MKNYDYSEKKYYIFNCHAELLFHNLMAKHPEVLPQYQQPTSRDQAGKVS